MYINYMNLRVYLKASLDNQKKNGKTNRIPEYFTTMLKTIKKILLRKFATKCNKVFCYKCKHSCLFISIFFIKAFKEKGNCKSKGKKQV